jgi:hypothetical protein
MGIPYIFGFPKRGDIRLDGNPTTPQVLIPHTVYEDHRSMPLFEWGRKAIGKLLGSGTSTKKIEFDEHGCVHLTAHNFQEKVIGNQKQHVIVIFYTHLDV